MQNHVKLEIAIQLNAEKIADLYKKLENANQDQKEELLKQLDEAFIQKEKISHGDINAIEEMLKENKNSKNKEQEKEF